MLSYTVVRTPLLFFLLAFSASSHAARAGSPPVPPASFPEDVTEAIAEAGGPDLSGNLRFEHLDKDGGRSYVANLDADGNPDPSGQHILRVDLSYQSGGSSGGNWVCSIEIVAPNGEITNAADNSPDSDLLADLMQASDEKYPLYNDPEVSAQFDKELSRSKKAAIKEAFKRLNQGLKGKVRITMQRDSQGQGVRQGGRSSKGPN